MYMVQDELSSTCTKSYLTSFCYSHIHEGEQLFQFYPEYLHSPKCSYAQAYKKRGHQRPQTYSKRREDMYSPASMSVVSNAANVHMMT